VSGGGKRALRRKAEGQLRHALNTVAASLLLLIGLRAGLEAEAGATIAQVLAPHLTEVAAVSVGPLAAHLWSWFAPEKRSAATDG
jgi:hypothetical protein